MTYAGDFTSFSARFQERSDTPRPREVFLEFTIGLTSLIVDLHQVESVHGALCPKCFQTTAAGEVIWNHEFKTLDAARSDRVTAARTTLHAASDGPGRGVRFTMELPPTPPPLSRRDKRSELGRMIQGGSS